MVKEIYYDQIHLNDGERLIAASNEGLVYIDLVSDTLDNLSAFFENYREEVYFVRDAVKISPYKKQLTEYFQGSRQAFELPLDFGQRGTSFQQAVWQALLTIPYGEHRSYSQIASAIGSPQGNRAVGTAVGKNPLPIVVPCHRILRKDGSIGGYSSGLPLKYQLLALEGIPCK